MSYWLLLALLAVCLTAVSCSGSGDGGEAPSPPRTTGPPVGPMPPLSPQEKHIILDKGTEQPFTGKHWDNTSAGVYLCRQCGSPLYLSDSKFKSGCGWPSFDDEIARAVKRQVDADGVRTEIICTSCGGHLGHVFLGEGMTAKDTRHCVNSASLMFVPAEDWPLQRAIFAGGCFWGVEHLLEEIPGVLAARSGYTGGQTVRPTYKQVCAGRTGHAEAVEILFDPAKVSYEQLARRFFEAHDPTQKDRQGPDVGTQYRSAVFYTTSEQKETAEGLIGLLRRRGYAVVTEVAPATTFWPAEDYHQDYLAKHPGHPTCHTQVDRFSRNGRR